MQTEGDLSKHMQIEFTAKMVSNAALGQTCYPFEGESGRLWPVFEIKMNPYKGEEHA
jgi:hypothetical protein